MLECSGGHHEEPDIVGNFSKVEAVEADPSWSPWEEHSYSNHLAVLTSDLTNIREYICVILKHQLYSNL